MSEAYGWVVLGARWQFGIVDVRLDLATVEFEAAAMLPGGTVIPSPCRSVIETLHGDRVVACTYEEDEIVVPPGPPQLTVIVQAICFTPDEGGRAHARMWRVQQPAGRLTGPPLRVLPGSGTRALPR